MATQTIERPVERPSADLEALFPGRYLSVTSFKRDGSGVATPMWFVFVEGAAYPPQPACAGRGVPRERQASRRVDPGDR